MVAKEIFNRGLSAIYLHNLLSLHRVIRSFIFPGNKVIHHRKRDS